MFLCDLRTQYILFNKLKIDITSFGTNLTKSVSIIEKEILA